MMFAIFFLEKANHELGKQIKGFTQEVEHIFKNYHWPGNLRELKNVVKRSALLSVEDFIGVHELPFELVNFDHPAFDLIAPEESEVFYNLPSYNKSSKSESAAENSPLLNLAQCLCP